MTRWITIGVGVLVVLAIAFIAVLYIFPDFRAATRDIAVVILALFQLIGTLRTIAILFAVLYAIRSVDKAARESLLPRVDSLTAKVDQLVDQTQQVAGKVVNTSATVSTTTNYVAEQVVSPFIRASGLLVGVRAAMSYLARRDER